MPPGPDIEAARRFLVAHLGAGVSAVELVGAGAWSRCFGFALAGRELVVRFGRQRDDFDKDRRATSFASARLPVPDVLEVGAAFDGWFAISTRARGEPLEHLDAAGWRAVLPSLLGVLDALHAVDLQPATGWGPWDAQGVAPFASWREFLLSVADDTPARRTAGWRSRLAASPFGDADFGARLAQLAHVSEHGDAVPRHLVHADLLNRNMLVDGVHISGVLDWGCSLYGDPIYDAAWVEFWAPWYPAWADADVVGALYRHLEGRVAHPATIEARRRACLLHIALDHYAYNAWKGDASALGEVIDRTRQLID